MMERHAQVGEDTIDMIGSVETQEIAQKTEVAVDKREARIVDRVGYGVGVLIEAQQTASITEPRHDGTGVSATTECHIDIRPVGLDVESVKCWLK